MSSQSLSVYYPSLSRTLFDAYCRAMSTRQTHPRNTLFCEKTSHRGLQTRETIDLEPETSQTTQNKTVSCFVACIPAVGRVNLKGQVVTAPAVEGLD